MQKRYRIVAHPPTFWISYRVHTVSFSNCVFLILALDNADNTADASSGDAFALDAAQKNSGGDVVEGNSVADGGLLDILTTGNGLGLL
jgi:hypothetical protein